MTKGQHPRALTLRVWASKIERNLLTPEEAQTIAEVLRRVANGEGFDAVLGVRRMANRPATDKTKYYVEQVHGLMQPVFSPREQQLLPGAPVIEAIVEVADACHVSISTVKTAYHSAAGRQYLDELNARLKDPLT
jgi:hypothetical protein